VPAYVVANIDVTDADGYRGYIDGVPDTIAAYGGRYIARGGEVEVLEGDWRPSRLVIVEFPTIEQARAWYHSEEYQPVKAVRIAHADSELVLTDGLAG
jgi:uncharacterized protein (DUF1330 family)